MGDELKVGSAYLDLVLPLTAQTTMQLEGYIYIHVEVFALTHSLFILLF